MKWISEDRTPVDNSWSDWKIIFAWWPVTIIDGYTHYSVWLQRVERRERKFRGIIFPEIICTDYEYREIAI